MDNTSVLNFAHMSVPNREKISNSISEDKKPSGRTINQLFSDIDETLHSRFGDEEWYQRYIWEKKIKSTYIKRNKPTKQTYIQFGFIDKYYSSAASLSNVLRLEFSVNAAPDTSFLSRKIIWGIYLGPWASTDTLTTVKENLRNNKHKFSNFLSENNHYVLLTPKNEYKNPSAEVIDDIATDIDHGFSLTLDLDLRDIIHTDLPFIISKGLIRLTPLYQTLIGRTENSKTPLIKTSGKTSNFEQSTASWDLQSLSLVGPLSFLELKQIVEQLVEQGCMEKEGIAYAQRYIEDVVRGDGLFAVSGCGPSKGRTLAEAGINTTEELVASFPESLTTRTDLSTKQIKRLQENVTSGKFISPESAGNEIREQLAEESSSDGLDPDRNRIPLTDLPAIGDSRSKKFKDKGFCTVSEIADADLDELCAVSNINRDTAACIREGAKEIRGDDDTVQARVADTCGCDREEVTEAYWSIAYQRGDLDTKSSFLIEYFGVTPENSILQLEEFSLRYLYSIYIDGFRCLEKITTADVDELAEASYIDNTKATEIKAAAKNEYISKRFETKAEDIENGITNLNHTLTPAKAQGQPIAHESALRDQIRNINSKINDLQEYRFQKHLSQSCSDTLDLLQNRIADIEAYVDTKVKFDGRIKSIEAKVSTLEHAVAPFLNYEKYLTRTTYKHLSQVLEQTESTIQKARSEINLGRLSSPDQKRFTILVENVSEIEKCLNRGRDRYNEEFVSRERDQYRDLFSDIGPNNLDLTPEQQRAVIRNGDYNQIIAAAGTGKTLTLTTRVAYLVKTQGVDPSDLLVVAFTNKAKDEMKNRLSDHFGIDDVQVKTVHAFGNSIIQLLLDQDLNTIDKNQTRNFVDRFIRTACSEDDDRFRSHYYKFLMHFGDVYFDETDFETKEDYIRARSEQRYQTLQNEQVKSRAEKRIADFLFTHQVDYRYEDLAAWAETSEDKKPYEPDFYLPEYDIYIEHFGIDAAGEVAPWFSVTTDEYHEKIRWARNQFEHTDSVLLETYEFEHKAKNLDSLLQSRLEYHGVELNRMEFEDLVEAAYDYNQREGWIKDRFVEFIQNAKRFEVKPDNIERQLNPDNPRQFHFGHCGIMILQRYQHFLNENDHIDFNDMITRSLELMQTNSDQYRPQYDHVLVDEFQDLGKGTLELIREFVGPESAHLFAVGDDWQSIYSFRGAVVDYFLNFDRHFGTPAQTTLTENFRSPPQIIEAGNTLINANDKQIEKEVKPTAFQDFSPSVHTLQGYSYHDYAHRTSRYAAALVQAYLQQGSEPEDIMVLCRFDGAVPYLNNIKSIFREVGIPYVGKSDTYYGENNELDGAVSVHSVHQSKGREAEHVILVHASEGPFGFPPSGRENELLEPVKPVEKNTVAEERRAFYVAITRSERTLDILTREGQKSRFLDEIEAYTEEVNQAESIEPLDDVGSEMTITAKVDHLFDDIDEKKHQSGYLVDQYGVSVRFISWKSDNPPTIEKNNWYRFENIKVNQYNGKKELLLTDRCSIEPVDSPLPNVS